MSTPGVASGSGAGVLGCGVPGGGVGVLSQSVGFQLLISLLVLVVVLVMVLVAHLVGV